MSIEDIIDILAIDLVGVVPDDENIIISTNKENQQLQITNPRQVSLSNITNVFWRIGSLMDLNGSGISVK